MIAFRCGACTEPIRVGDDQASREHTCPWCSHVNVVPSRPVLATAGRPQGFTRTASSTIWTVAGLLALALAGWGIWSVAGPAGTSAATSAPATPAEVLQQELLRKNFDAPGDPILNQMYSDIGARHFGGKLPEIQVLWEPRLAEVGKLAAQTFTLQGMFGHLKGQSVILLNPSLQSDKAAIARALCHEIAHAFLYATGVKTSDHGPVFQSLLRWLADEGAFQGVVASDEERDQLRRWLDAESQRLDAERAAIDRLTIEIERDRLNVERVLAALNARVIEANAQGFGWPPQSEIAAANAKREAYNQEATEANDRAERDRKDFEHFNREVERYNLMLVYPDGLDARPPVDPKARGSRAGRK